MRIETSKVRLVSVEKMPDILAKGDAVIFFDEHMIRICDITLWQGKYNTQELYLSFPSKKITSQNKDPYWIDFVEMDEHLTRELLDQFVSKYNALSLRVRKKQKDKEPAEQENTEEGGDDGWPENFDL